MNPSVPHLMLNASSDLQEQQELAVMQKLEQLQAPRDPAADERIVASFETAAANDENSSI